MTRYKTYDPKGNETRESSLEEIAERFERDGLVVFPEFLPASHLERLNAELDAHYAPLLARAGEILGEQSEQFKQFECDVIAWDPCGEGQEAFIALRDSSDLQSVTAACLGTGFEAPRSLVMAATGGGKGQAWHQDCPPGQSTRFNLNRLFYTRDVLLEDGAIVVVPGSHRMGRIPPGGNQEPIPGEVALVPTAGTLVLLHGHVFHRVTPNLSGRPRISTNFRAFARGVSEGVCDVGVYRNGAYDFALGQLVDAASVPSSDGM